MPNPRESNPRPKMQKFLQLMQELQVEYELLHSALASAEGLNSSRGVVEGQTPTKTQVTKPSSLMEDTCPDDSLCDIADAAKGEDTEVDMQPFEPCASLKSVSMPPDLIEDLQFEFDVLDTEHEDRVPLSKVIEIVESNAQDTFDRDDLTSVLRELCDHTKVKTANSAMIPSIDVSETESSYMTFDDLLHLMAVPTQTTPPDANVGLASLATFQKAFHNFALQTRASEAEEKIKREKHNQLGVLLDVVPAPVIILNSIVMGFQADTPDIEFWKVVDIFFLVFYIGEAIVKSYFLTCRRYLCGAEKFWNWFDLVCIGISTFDITYEVILPALSDIDEGSSIGELMLMKMLRLAKLARLVKALHYSFFKELKLMVNGVMSGMRVLLWAIVLLIVVIFFLGVCMKNMVPQVEEFGTVPKAMFTVFRCFTDGCSAYDGTPLIEHLRHDYGYWFVIPYMLVFMFVTFGLFNLIMAIFINNVQGTEEERLLYDLGTSAKDIKTKFETFFVKKIIFGHSSGKRHHLLEPQLRRECLQLYRSDPHLAYQKLPKHLEITGKIFDLWLQDDELLDLLDEAEVQTANCHELFDVLDADMSGQLTVIELVNGLMRLRGPITKSEMVAVRMKIRHLTQEVHHIVARICPRSPEEERENDTQAVSLQKWETQLSRMRTNNSRIGK